MSAEDDIRNTLALYCQALDAHDYEGYISTFTKNTRFYAGAKLREGHAGIKDHLDYIYPLRPEGLRSRHALATSIIKVNGDTAEAKSVVIVHRSVNNSPWEIALTGEYHDKLVIEDGMWRIDERRIEADFSIIPNK